MAPTICCVTLSRKSKISSRAPSNRSPHRWGLVVTSISCPAMRRRLPALRTLPSSTYRTPNLFDVDSLAFVGEGRVTGDNEQRLEPGQRCDDVFHHPVGEI